PTGDGPFPVAGATSWRAPGRPSSVKSKKRPDYRCVPSIWRGSWTAIAGRTFLSTTVTSTNSSSCVNRWPNWTRPSPAPRPTRWRDSTWIVYRTCRLPEYCPIRSCCSTNGGQMLERRMLIEGGGTDVCWLCIEQTQHFYDVDFLQAPARG